MDFICVIGGGPSLKGFDFSKLRDLDTIAVNSAIQDVPNPTYFITCDSGFVKRAVRAKFWNVNTKKILIFTHKILPYESYFDLVIEPKSCGGGIGFTMDNFITGCNSGFCALQYAVLLGYKKIYLLGIDLDTKGGNHYHNRTNLYVSHLKTFYNHFVDALAVLKNTDIKVISCSPISRLNEFIPYMPFDKCI